MKIRWGKMYRYSNLFSNKGFTFVEMLCAFSLFLIIASFFPLGFSLIYQDGLVKGSLQRMEWEVFISQVKKELRMSENITVTNNKLILLKDNQTIIYEQYGSSIRRRVNFQGHEIMLQNIKSVTIENNANVFQLSVDDLFDQHETVRIQPILHLENANVP